VASAAVTGVKSGVKALLSRVVLWRVGVRWYVIALGLPTVLALAAAGLYYLVGGSTRVQMGAVSALDFVVFVLVVGEELGWRGYALPLLLEKRSAVTASLILGVLWGLWHLPTFLVPGTPQYGLPLPAFLLLTVEYSILMTWLFLHTKGSVLLATLLHGAINLSQGLFLGGIDGATRYWLLSIVYGATALVVAFGLGLKSFRKSSTRSEAPVQAKDV
jgi:membrane protease YdiL (CAAX protease family)